MNALEIKNLSKKYKGFQLDNVTLTLPSGCIMGLIGENGAGKSTLFKLILGMARKDSGSITILGQDADKTDKIKDDLGVVPDEIGLPLYLNVKEIGNIMKHTFRRWDENIYRGYIKNLALPEKKKFKEFSRGMKMKLGFAIAMSHHPKLLLLDEATSGLDPVVRDEITDMLMDYTRDENHSVLISSHIVSDLEKLCDYVAFIHKGQLMLQEEKDILLEKYALIHCQASALDRLDSASIIGKKVTDYGAEAIVLKDRIPRGVSTSPISIEELFVFMAKEV